MTKNKDKSYDTNSKADSIVEACLPFTDSLCGKIVHVSFDCPENLRNVFKSATKANGTTSCHTLRGLMQAYIVASHYRKACFPNTNEPIVIEKLVMPTFVKSRVRRYGVKTKTLEGSCFKCGSTSDLVYARFFSGVEYIVCRICLQNDRSLKLTLKKVLGEVNSSSECTDL